MHWLPLVVSLVAAAAITPATIRSLAAQGMVRENYRGALVAFPAGIALIIPAMVALVVAAPLYQLVDLDVLQPGFGLALVYVFGIGFLGLLDDLVGSAADQPRGWRGHFAALGSGRVSTGVIKAIGALGLALFVAADPQAGAGTYVLSTAVLVLATNVFRTAPSEILWPLFEKRTPKSRVSRRLIFRCRARRSRSTCVPRSACGRPTCAVSRVRRCRRAARPSS